MIGNVAAIAQWVKWAGLPVGIALLMLVMSTARAVAALCPAQLADQLDAALDQPPLGTAYTGMVLQTQGLDPRTLYDRSGDRLFTPASNIKLLTTAAAAHRLGGDYRLRTSVYGAPNNEGSTALRVIGRGDPSFTTTQIEDLVQQLVQAGVRQVPQLVIDDSYFPGFATNPTWEWEDAQWAYATPVNSLILNRNAVVVQIAPTEVGNPLLVQPQPQPAGLLPVINATTTAEAGASNSLSLWRTGDSPTVQVAGQLAVS
ncbi:MAG: D-alanyl-D-alanine carboxypeptidase/D-alanyl-D-alanine-endopeptidase, partial [Nodosilinea sp.]